MTPDASHLIYAAILSDGRAELWVRKRDQQNPTHLAGTAGGRQPFVSPDGERVGFFMNGELRVVSIRGGPPTTLTDTLVGGAGASWGKDGVIYSDALGPAALVRVPEAGGTPEWFTRLDTAAGETDHLWPSVLPNGNGVLFTARYSAGRADQIAVADRATGSHRVLVPGQLAVYARSGHLLYVTGDGTLMGAPFDQKSMEVTGEVVPLANRVTLRTNSIPDVTIADVGTLVYTTGGLGRTGGEPVWVGRDGEISPAGTQWTEMARSVALSPDGQRLALGILNGASQEIWIHGLAAGTASKLTFDGDVNQRPSWSSDGLSVGFASDRLASSRTWFVRRADGTAEAHPAFILLGLDLQEGTFTRDGRWIVYRQGGGQFGNLYARRTEGDTLPVPLAVTVFQESAPAVSPGGRWLAYVSTETGRPEVYVRPFPDVSSGKWLVSVSGGTEPVWSGNGRELFYRNGNGDMVAVEVLPQGAPPTGRQQVLFSARSFLQNPLHQKYDVTTDGQRFVMIRPSGGAGLGDLQIVVIENFFEELKAKVGN